MWVDYSQSWICQQSAPLGPLLFADCVVCGGRLKWETPDVTVPLLGTATNNAVREVGAIGGFS